MRPSNSLIMSALSVGAGKASTVIWAYDIVRASFQAIVTGSPNGTLQLQASNDQATGLPANQFVPTNWSNIGTSITVGAAGTFFIPEVECSYEYMRLLYADSSGGTATGTISARMKAMAL